MPTLQSLDLLGVIEEALVRHRPFGDSTYILDQFQFCSKRRLSVIAAELPSAGWLLDALQTADGNSRYRLTGNTVVRCAIQHAHTQVETNTEYGLPLADCEKIFEATALHLQLRKPGTPLESRSVSRPRLGAEPYHGLIWDEDYPDDIFGRSFRFLVKQNYGDALCTPSDDEIATLIKGEQLLQILLPLLAPSALSHAHLIGIFPHVGGWKGKASSSQIKLGGTIFLGRCIMRSPWIVAEHLLHEALHQKLYDFRHGHSLLEPDFAERGAPRIRSPWNPEELNEANHWDAHRAFAAFHVYVQLSLLSLLAERRAAELEELYGPAEGMIESRKAFERAWYLGEQLKEVCWNVLGLAGKRLVDWLMSILHALEPSPPPRGADFHLVLDLYKREAKKVDATLMTRESAPSALSSKLVPLVKEEVEDTRRILSTINAERQLDQFNDALGQFADNELGAQFSNVRGIVARTLLNASPDGYGLSSVVPESEDPNDLVRQMVLSASQRLYVTLEGIPDAVAAAKRRAHRLRFTMSCIDQVGRLLAVLAAAVPQGGRILEIGTGVGVGAAWISVGLDERTDVEVISVEVDRQLSDAAMEWPWPPHMRIVTADALEALGTLGAFHLMFVDASPIKHGHIESTIRALRPGGVLVIDDLHTDMRNLEVQKAQKDTLRRLLLHHPSLQAVELDWASGVILATHTCKAG
jgi:predicted O-methyltransferase YrrM